MHPEEPSARPAARPVTTMQRGPSLAAATILLLLAAFLRLWALSTTPPGLHAGELINTQLSDRLRQGDIAVIYDDVEPAREGLYYALLAGSTTLTGRGLMLWRLPSVWLSMLSLSMTTVLMRRLFGRRVALMTLGLMAVTFWAVWMGRTVGHVALLPLAATFTLYTFVRAFTARRQTYASLWFTIGGIALGLTQYVHVTAWTLPALFLAYILYRTLVNRSEIRQHRANIWYTLALAVVIDIPLAIYLIRYPGAREPVPITQQPGLIAEVPERLVASLAALTLRGDMLPTHNLPGRPVLGPVIGALLIVGIGVALARWRRPPYGFALLWLGIGPRPTAFLPRRPDFEQMAVILPLVSALPALGLRALYQVARERFSGLLRPLSLAALGALVAALIGVNALGTYRDYFIAWPAREDVQAAYGAESGRLAHYLDTSADPTPVSVCSSPVDRAEEPFALTHAELLDTLMHRSDLPIRYFDCRQSLVIADGGESQRIIFPRSHYYDELPGPLLAWMRYAHSEDVPGVGPDVVMRLEASDELADYAGAFTTTALTAGGCRGRAGAAAAVVRLQRHLPRLRDPRRQHPPRRLGGDDVVLAHGRPAAAGAVAVRAHARQPGRDRRAGRRARRGDRHAAGARRVPAAQHDPDAGRAGRRPLPHLARPVLPRQRRAAARLRRGPGHRRPHLPAERHRRALATPPPRVPLVWRRSTCHHQVGHQRTTRHGAQEERTA